MPFSLGESGERYSGANEDVLLAQLRVGDEAAFLTLVDRYATTMQKIARAYVRDDATAADVVQEAWLGGVCNDLAFTETNVRVLLPGTCEDSPYSGFLHHRRELRVMPDLDCIDLVELTTEYFEGKLSPDETARLEADLTECDGCTEFIRHMRVTQDVPGRIDSMVVPAAGREQLLGTFRAWKSEETERSSD